MAEYGTWKKKSVWLDRLHSLGKSVDLLICEHTDLIDYTLFSFAPEELEEQIYRRQASDAVNL